MKLSSPTKRTRHTARLDGRNVSHDLAQAQAADVCGDRRRHCDVQDQSKMNTSTLFLFVWEAVLTDYTDGLVCILAHSEDEAWELLKEKDHTAWWTLRGDPEDRNDPRSPSELGADAKRPKQIDSPAAFLVWGGG